MMTQSHGMAGRREYQTFRRKIRILDLLPDQAQGFKTAREIHESLKGEGLDIDRRGVERDLNELSRMFPLGKRHGRPAGWYWLRDTKLPPMLGMDVETALVYQLLERFLEPLLPRVLWARLLPQFARAREQLQTHSSAGLAQWNHRVAVDPGTQPLMQPPLDGKTLGAVNSALLESRQLAFDYRRAGADRTAPPKHHVVAPYGLVLRGQTLYLIARPTLGRQSSDPLAFALHRMTEAKVTAARAIVPPTFNLERDVAAAGAIGIQQGAPIRLELRVTPWWAEFLSESRLSDDQVIAQIRGSDDRRVTATVANTEQLCWWLLSLGREVEVLKPAKLRRKMADETAASARRYKVRDRRVGRD